MESFFEAGLRKKNEQIGLFYIPFWYYTRLGNANRMRGKDWNGKPDPLAHRLFFGLEKFQCAKGARPKYTKLGYKIVESCEVIFSQTNEKNYCISGNMESFFEAGLRKKNEQIGLFYIPFWYYTRLGNANRMRGKDWNGKPDPLAHRLFFGLEKFQCAKGARPNYTKLGYKIVQFGIIFI